jgi:hypothetical protein
MHLTTTGQSLKMLIGYLLMLFWENVMKSFAKAPQRTIQVAFDATPSVFEAVRRAAFENNLSASDQVRRVLSLPLRHHPKRPRLTLSLTPDDCAMLGERYDIPAENLREIKERAGEDLAIFGSQQARRRKKPI